VDYKLRRGGPYRDTAKTGVTEPRHKLLDGVFSGDSTMPAFKNDTMHRLETTIEKYGTTGETSTESAIRDLLTDLRHYCDRHEIAFEDCLEGSLDVYLEEQESADNERSEFDCQDVEAIAVS